jgi:hypothetical protein
MFPRVRCFSKGSRLAAGGSNVSKFLYPDRQTGPHNFWQIFLRDPHLAARSPRREPAPLSSLLRIMPPQRSRERGARPPRTTRSLNLNLIRRGSRGVE